MNISPELKTLVEEYKSIFANRPHQKNLSAVEKKAKSLFSSRVQRGDPSEKVKEIQRLINETKIKVVTREDRLAGRQLSSIKKRLNELADNLLSTGQTPNRSRKRKPSETNVLAVNTKVPSRELEQEFITPGVAINRDLENASENTEPSPTNSIDAVFRALDTQLPKAPITIIMQYYLDTVGDIIKPVILNDKISDSIKTVAESLTIVNIKACPYPLPFDTLKLFKNAEVLIITDLILKGAHPDLLKELGKFREFTLLSDNHSFQAYMKDYIADKDLAKLANSQTLQKLELFNCKNITNKGLNLLKVLTNLQYITLQYPGDITGTELFLFAQNFTSLQSLGLRSANINDEDLASIREKFLNITSLDLSNNKNITDVGIAYLIENFPNLESLNLSYCSKITDSSCPQFANLKHLKFLSLKGCNFITQEGIACLEKHPSLQYINLKNTNDNFYYLLAYMQRNDPETDDPSPTNLCEHYMRVSQDSSNVILTEVHPSLKVEL